MSKKKLKLDGESNDVAYIELPSPVGEQSNVRVDDSVRLRELLFETGQLGLLEKMGEVDIVLDFYENSIVGIEIIT